MENKIIGTVKQVVGPIVDVQFKNRTLPELLTALIIPLKENKSLTIEVMQHIGDDVVRCVSMGPTEGLRSNFYRKPYYCASRHKNLRTHV